MPTTEPEQRAPPTISPTTSAPTKSPTSFATTNKPIPNLQQKLSKYIEENNPERALEARKMIDNINKIDKYSKDNPLYDIQVLSAKEAYIKPNIRYPTLAGFTYDRDSSDDVLAIYKKDKQVVIAIRGSQGLNDWIGNYFNLMSGNIDSSTAFGKVLNDLRAYVNKPENKDLDISLTGHSKGSMLSYYFSYILTLDNLATNRKFPSVGFALGKTVFSEGVIPSVIQTALKLMAKGDATGRDALNNLIIGKLFDTSIKTISKISPIDLTSYMAIMTPNIGAPALVASSMYAILEKGNNLIAIGDALKIYENGFSNWYSGSSKHLSEQIKNKFKNQLKDAGIAKEISTWANSIPDSVINIAVMTAFSAGNKKTEKLKKKTKSLYTEMLLYKLLYQQNEDEFWEEHESPRFAMAHAQRHARNMEEFNDINKSQFPEQPPITPHTTKSYYKQLEEFERKETEYRESKAKLGVEKRKTELAKKGLDWFRTIAGYALLAKSIYGNIKYNDAKVYQKMMRDGIPFNNQIIKPVRKFISYNVKDNHMVGVDAGISKALTELLGVDPLSEGSRRFFTNPNNRENGNVKLVEVEQNIYDNSMLPSHSMENYIPPKYRSKDYIKQALKGMYKEQDIRKKRKAIPKDRDEL